MKRFLSFLPLFLLAGCSLPIISPEQRAYSLVAGVNSASRDVLADDFLPTIADLAKLRDAAQYPALWEASFPYEYAPYRVTILDASNPAAATLTIAANIAPPLPDPWNVPQTVLLVMGRIGNDWFIQRMEMPPLTVIVQ